MSRQPVREPYAVAGDIDGNILVADRQSGQVYLFDWYGTTIGASPYASCSGSPDARPFLHP